MAETVLNTDTGAGALSGVTVLVTRPAPQNRALAEALTQQGAEVLLMPALCIEPVEVSDSSCLSADIVLFVSANAVRYGLPVLQRHATGLSGVMLGAVGQRTAACLQAAGQTVFLLPDHYDSEGLLALPALQQVAGKRVLIVRGQGGREQLARVLRHRGASVAYLECYRRVLPDADYSRVLQRGQAGEIDIIVTSSNQVLENFVCLCQGARWPFTLPLVVASQRGRERALQLGFTGPVIVVPRMSDTGILEAVCQWRSAPPSG